MPTNINHKGTWCIYNSNIFCQESYCSGCFIYQNKDKCNICELAKDKEMNGGNMILYNGKAKDYSFKQLLYNVYWVLSRPIEKLEPEDFSKN